MGDGCSAMILCCEPPTAFPKPPVGGALAAATESKQESITVTVNAEKNVKVVKTKESTYSGSVTEIEKTNLETGVVTTHKVWAVAGKSGKKGSKGKKGKKGFIPMPTVAPTTAAPASTPGFPSSGPSNFPSFITTSTFSATLSESQSGSAAVTVSATATGTSGTISVSL